MISGIWELPFGSGKSWLNSSRVLDKFVGDVHSITRPKGGRTVERWFNTAGFDTNSTRQLQFNYWTFLSRLNDVRADGTNLWDLSVLKNTRLQFRAEFLNAWNHPSYSTGLSFHLVGLFRYLDLPDLSALIAPRPVRFMNGFKDALFVQGGLKAAYEKIGRCYEKASASDRQTCRLYDVPHQFNAEMQAET